jgi:hypothetical protein
MKATQKLHNLGQSLWLDNITRDLLNSGALRCDSAHGARRISRTNFCRPCASSSAATLKKAPPSNGDKEMYP